MEFGIAAGVLQVAGAGVQLAKTLHACATSFRDAKKDIVAIATEVQLTSSALESLGLELEKDREICSAKLREDVRAAMKGCEGCFNELNAMVKASVKTDGASATVMATMSFTAKAKWMLNKNKMKTLKTDLGQQKVTLMLMLEILACAARQSSRTAAQPAEIAESDRLRIEKLVKSNEELHRSLTEKANSQGYNTPQTAPISTARDLGDESVASAFNLVAVQLSGSSNSAKIGADTTAVPPTQHKGAVQHEDTVQHDDPILAAITNCQKALERLAGCLQEANSDWRTTRAYDSKATQQYYGELQHAMNALPVTSISRPKKGPKKVQEKVSLGEFLKDQTLGSWADEMEEDPTPAPAARPSTQSAWESGHFTDRSSSCPQSRSRSKCVSRKHVAAVGGLAGCAFNKRSEERETIIVIAGSRSPPRSRSRRRRASPRKRLASPGRRRASPESSVISDEIRGERKRKFYAPTHGFDEVYYSEALPRTTQAALDTSFAGFDSGLGPKPKTRKGQHSGWAYSAPGNKQSNDNPMHSSDDIQAETEVVAPEGVDDAGEQDVVSGAGEAEESQDTAQGSVLVEHKRSEPPSPKAPYVPLVTSPTGDHERIADEDDKAALSPLPALGETYASIGLRGLGFNVGPASSFGNKSRPSLSGSRMNSELDDGTGLTSPVSKSTVSEVERLPNFFIPHDEQYAFYYQPAEVNLEMGEEEGEGGEWGEEAGVQCVEGRGVDVVEALLRRWTTVMP